VTIEIITNISGLDGMEGTLSEVVKSFDEFLEWRFSESRRKAYYSVLPDVDSRKPAAASEEKPKGGGMVQGVRSGEGDAGGGSAL